MVKHIVVAMCSGALCVCAAMQLKPKKAEARGARNDILVRLFNRASCPMLDIPLAATETGTTAVSNTLRYDEVLYREYRTPMGIFTLYAAYWGAGKMPTQLVSSHTPDRCWVNAGWRLVRADLADVTTFGISGGQQRVFEMQGKTQHVVFWHFVNRRAYNYRGNETLIVSTVQWWREAMAQTVHSPPEQYFIRVSCDRPLSGMTEDPAFSLVLQQVAQILLPL